MYQLSFSALWFRRITIHNLQWCLVHWRRTGSHPTCTQWNSWTWEGGYHTEQSDMANCMWDNSPVHTASRVRFCRIELAISPREPSWTAIQQSISHSQRVRSNVADTFEICPTAWYQPAYLGYIPQLIDWQHRYRYQKMTENCECVFSLVNWSVSLSVVWTGSWNQDNQQWFRIDSHTPMWTRPTWLAELEVRKYFIFVLKQSGVRLCMIWWSATYCTWSDPVVELPMSRMWGTRSRLAFQSLPSPKTSCELFYLGPCS